MYDAMTTVFFIICNYSGLLPRYRGEAVLRPPARSNILFSTERRSAIHGCAGGRKTALPAYCPTE
jgi:hypothetical protein